MNLVAKKISQIRRAKGLTQEELAEQSQVNLRTIQRIENNESTPRGKTLQLISEALQIDLQDLTTKKEESINTSISNQIINGLFLLALNLILMSIFGYLTLDVNATRNSLFAAVLLSFFLPFFIVFCTQQMSGVERMLKFGSGFVIYFFSVIAIIGFPVGFTSGLFPCLLIAVGVLYFGHELTNKF